METYTELLMKSCDSDSCPICGDELTGTRPQWSDTHDNIVCGDCSDKANG